MKIDVVAWGDEISGLSFKSADKQSTITAHSFRYSAPVAYSGPLLMEIYRNDGGKSDIKQEPLSDDDKGHQIIPLTEADAETGPDDKTKAKQGLALELENRRKKNPSLVALASLPGSSCPRATVLLAPADGGTFTAYVIDDDPSKLPLGQLRVHNLSPYEILVRCNGTQSKELKTRESFIASSNRQQVVYELAYKLEEKWKMQENNIIPIGPNEQAQMIVLKSKNRYFLSTDGAGTGFLQIVTLLRGPTAR